MTHTRPITTTGMHAQTNTYVGHRMHAVSRVGVNVHQHNRKQLASTGPCLVALALTVTPRETRGGWGTARGYSGARSTSSAAAVDAQKQ
jgi:hypothetical protein